MALTAVVVTGALLISAVAGGVRQIAYGALAALVLAGLWPLALLVGGFAALMIVAIIAGVVGGEAVGDIGLGDVSEGVVRGGTKVTAWYYRLVIRAKHPVVWGVVAGVSIGTGLLWAFLVLSVFPRERQTLETLTRLQAAVELQYQTKGSYPASADGTVPTDLRVGPDAQSGAPVTDAFGHPIRYRVSGAWKVATYTIESLGFDGRQSDDDLCVSGGTRLGTWAQRASTALRGLSAASAAPSSKLGLRWQLAAIQASRCEPPP
jgi:hypothetical protein